MPDYSHITPGMLTEEVIILSQENPEVIYTPTISSCSYVNGISGDGNGCIFGRALHNLGVSKEHLKQFENIYRCDNTGIKELAKYLQIGFDPRWQLVQNEQDHGIRWELAAVGLLT